MTIIVKRAVNAGVVIYDRVFSCVIVRGVLRLFGILIGWKAHSSHEVATHNLMILGFMIEGYVLSQVGMERFRKDFHGLRDLDGAVFWGMVLVIFLLLFHQFAIFRNFSLPLDISARNEKQVLLSGIHASVSSLEGGRPVADVVDKLKSIVATPPIKRSKQWLGPRIKKLIEICIYGLFGVLTGEAGYMLTVLHEHDRSHWTAVVIESLFGTKGYGWGHSLECVFLICAIGICCCVLIWDYLVWLSPDIKQEYGALINVFMWNDWLSLAFWTCLFAIVTPSSRWWLGARIVQAEVDTELGLCAHAWLVLLVFSSLFVYKVGKRFVCGVQALGMAGSYSDARFEKI